VYVGKISKHHVIGKRNSKKTIKIHMFCHKVLHNVFTNKELYGTYNTVKKIRDSREAQVFRAWVHQQAHPIKFVSKVKRKQTKHYPKSLKRIKRRKGLSPLAWVLKRKFKVPMLICGFRIEPARELRYWETDNQQFQLEEKRPFIMGSKTQYVLYEVIKNNKRKFIGRYSKLKYARKEAQLTLKRRII